MITHMDDLKNMDIQELIIDLPDEVTDFVFGDGMAEVRTKLQQELQDQQQTDVLAMHIELMIFGAEEPEDVAKRIQELPVAEDRKKTIAAIVQHKVVEELLLLVEARKEIDEEDGNKTSSATAPSPSDILDSLKTRLAQAATVAPIVRPQGPAVQTPPSDAATTPASSEQEKKADPYREQV